MGSKKIEGDPQKFPKLPISGVPLQNRLPMFKRRESKWSFEMESIDTLYTISYGNTGCRIFKGGVQN